MRIVVRPEKGADWRRLESAGYHDEKEFQALLAESPSLIPIAEVREGASPLVAAVREVWLPSAGAIDLLAFSSDGEVTVIECKLVANSDRRQALAQVIDYASELQGLDYDKLNDRVHKMAKSDLASLVEKGTGPDWNEEVFRQGVAAALESGFFNLIIAIDKIDDHLRRMIEYLNRIGRPEFRLAGLEMERFKSDIGEVLVRRVYAPQITSRPNYHWNDTRFYKACQESLSEKALEVITGLHEWRRENFAYGSREKLGSLNYYLSFGARRDPWAFQVTHQGRVSIAYDELSKSIGEKATRRFQEQLSKIPSFARLPSDLMTRPSLSIESSLVNKPQDVEQFKAAVKELERELRG